TEIVLHDLNDFPNGFANNFPYNRIELFASPPSADDELAYFDDYLRLLVFHEYTHILHLDQVGGLPALVNSIFGKLILPNHAAPGWIIEGFATYVESAASGRGRLQSSLLEMYLRAAFLKDGLLTIDRLTDTPIVLPRGASAYLYGSFFLDFIFQKTGAGKFADYINEYGGKIIPYSLNTTAKKNFGKTFLEFYDDFIAALKERYQKEIDWIRLKGIIAGTPLTSGGEYKFRPVFADDGGSIAYITSDGRNTSSIVLKKSAKEETLFNCYGGCSNLKSDGKGKLYFIAGRYFKNYRFYNDLFRIDINTKMTDRLTYGGRIREFDFLPDGGIIYSKCEFDRCSLNALDTGSPVSKEIFYDPEYEIVSHPAASEDGKSVVFSAFRNSTWDLYLLDVETAKATRLTADENLERDAVFTPDGSGVIFSSDKGGIFNLRYLKIECVENGGCKEAKLTNVLLGAFQPSVSGNKLLYSGYTPDGYEIFLIDEWLKFQSADNETTETCESPAIPGEIPSPIQAKEYNPLESLKPRSVQPQFVFDSGGVSRLGFLISAEDAVRQHSFDIKADSDTESLSPVLNFQYENNRYYPTISANFSYYKGGKVALFNDEYLFEQTRNFAGSLSAAFPFYGVKHNFRITAGWFFDYSRKIDGANDDYDPASISPFFPKTGFLSGPFAGVNYDSTERFVYSVSPEKGVAAGVSFSYTPPALLSDFYSWLLLGNLDVYFKAPFIKQSVFSVKSVYGTGFGEEGAEQVFSLGGFPRQDIFASLLNQEHLSSRYLRGYPENAFYGNKFYLFNVEYRFPLFYIFKGLDTLPLFFRNVHGAFFLDTGDAFFDSTTVKYGAGAELRFDLTAMYQFPYHFKLGYAHGFSEFGGDFVYFLLGLY
ncbi:MAG: PD40 domain-containing protein, partial [Deltaproteobacteria bacterium]|nr:PD40 domain-containing protein [Deltaproteobacteria bacterium]